MQTAFELVYPFACLIAAIMLPVMVTPWMPDKPRKAKAAKAKRTVRKYKKPKNKNQKWFKAPKLTIQQQAAIEPYRLGGSRFAVSAGGGVPL